MQINRVSKHIASFEFNILMRYLIWQKQKKYDRRASVENVDSTIIQSRAYSAFPTYDSHGSNQILRVSIFVNRIRVLIPGSAIYTESLQGGPKYQYSIIFTPAKLYRPFTEIMRLTKKIAAISDIIPIKIR